MVNGKWYMVYGIWSMVGGQSLIELLIAIGLAAILLPALLTGIISSREGIPQQDQRIAAISLLKETQDAVRSVREKGWSTFAINGTYHPTNDGTQWSLAANPTTVGDLTQQVVIEDVYRLNGTIVTSGGTLDASTKKITTSISWTTPIPSSITSVTYLTRYLENAAYTDTTKDQTDLALQYYPFNAGTKTGVTVQATSPPAITDDGEIFLASGGHSNWCSPELTTNTLDLPKNGVANALYAISDATLGSMAFAATGENSSGVSFAKANLSNTPPYPPTASLANTFDGYKTNGVFGETGYAYIATDNNTKHVVIIDLNQIVSGKYVEVGYLNAGTSTNANSVYVTANTAYVTVGDDLYTFDVTIKSGSHSPLDSIDLPGTSGTSVVTSGNYAYVSIAGDAKELQLINVSNPSNLSLAGYADVNGQAAYDVAINFDSTRAYLATGLSSSQREMFIVDISTKTGSRPSVGSYEANGMDPNAIALVPGNRAILVGTSGEEYQVINITNESSPARCGGVEVNNGINDVASVLEPDNDAYSYILVATDPEFRIVQGGSGGGYASSGTFESATFDPGYTTANNRFTATYSQPSGTTLQFQVSMANQVGGVCPSTGSYTFIGPDSANYAGSYFTQASGVPATFPFTTVGNYTNPGRCIRYKAYFTGNGTSTPVLNDVSINYSP